MREQESHKIIEKSHLLEAEKIGIYSTIAGLAEVSVGTAINALHLPLRGYLMPMVQTFLLITFGKELRGKGLFWIVFISTGLKAFSPAGQKLKLMVFIFVQGMMFCLPVRLLGWNIFTAVLGSVLLGLSTLFIDLFLAYITYGQSIIDAMVASSRLLFDWMGLTDLTFWKVVGIISCIKLTLFFLLGVLAYGLDFTGWLVRWQKRIDALESADIDLSQEVNWKMAFMGSLKDMSMKYFIIPFIFAGLLLFFFAHLKTSDFVSVMIRGLVITWFGFVLARRINFISLIRFLHRRGYGHIAWGLEHALKKVISFRNKHVK